MIGVSEKNCRKERVIGVKTFLQDNDVQQFVNSKVNRHVKFLVYADKGDGEDINVIHISKDQQRPIYLAKDFSTLKKKVVYIRHGSSTDEAGPDEIADMGTETVQVEKPDVSLEFEFTTDSWVEQQFGPRLPGQEPKIVTYNYIKVYAKNLSGGLAHHFEGSIWVPVQFLFQVLFERQIARAKTTEEIINSEPYQIEINNKLSVGSRIQFQNPPPAEWQPFSPGRRLLLKKIVLMPHYEQMMRRFPCSIPWQFSVNGGDVVKGATKFADIPYLDNRSPAHKK